MMDLIQIMRISGTGLAAQRAKINVVTDNLANAETTRSAEGGPYRRKMVVFEEAPVSKDFKATLADEEKQANGVVVSETVRSQEDYRLVHNPTHPDADPLTGYVAMPNVDTMTELADMMVARRAYDANVTAMSNTKSMILKALEIGK
ncbi:MAG: flagellar basal body rod protein FlgC [Desulfobacterales bacterium]|jgi:flagellar basal-body rod protein FlgC|nr:flagellar basal body rod protein FlgC [Desulfobacterales bacterium]